MTQKTTSNNTSHEIQAVTQGEFLSVLYPQSPAEGWLEIRCIHPETGEVSTLWTQLTNLKQRDAVLKQADKLNAEGFGVFFAPSLRKEKKGSAASAILLPALWVDVDCDDDQQKREKGMAKLCSFDPAPSIIVDSGGGWHAYWLLDEPFLLEIDDDKQKISQIMQGIFTALDGDKGYVKSVASIMRLPNSINTKPERNNALVRVIEWNPERRYALSSFEWLEVKPKPQNSYMPVFSTNGNGHHPLPPRTEQYLTSGAYDGSRNAELFAAACQMRDAGYSQSDTEQELVARHVADGNGTENPAAREKEARSTIASAYSQSAREPIASPKQHARQVVQQLVGQYQLDQKPERPTTAQIVEAVEACIHLNPIEWAEERQSLKAVCGDGLKISDIDRLYKEKKKAVERQQQQEYVDSESYLMLVLFPYRIQSDNRGEKATVMSPSYMQKNFPRGWEYLLECEEPIKSRENGRLSKDQDWYRYIYPKNGTLFEKEKLVSPDISLGGNFAYDAQSQFYMTTTVYGYIKNVNVKEDYRFWLGLMNSKLVWFYLQNTGTVLANGYFRYKPAYLENFPVPEKIDPQHEQVFVTLVDYISYIKALIDTKSSAHARDAVMLSYFEQIIDALVYELYFPDELHSHDRYFMRLLQRENLPALNQPHENQIRQIRQIFERLFETNHPVRQALFFLDTLPIIRTIEGKE